MKRILLLDRNRLHLRRLTRVLTATGAEVVAVETPGELAKVLDDGFDILCADEAHLGTFLKTLSAHPDATGVCWTQRTDPDLLARAAEVPNLNHILGAVEHQGGPRAWELLWTVKRLVTGRRPPLSSLLHWGYTGFKETVHTPMERDRVVEGVVQLCERFGTPGRVRDMLGELTHELLMNAMYDAPVDQDGVPRYAQDRKAPISLSEEEAPVVRCASDGLRILVSVEDPFGLLPRRKIFGGMARGLSTGTMDQSHGGAGLGMLYVYKSTVLSVFDVEPGVRTEVIGLYDFDLNQRTFKSLPRSVHYFVSKDEAERDREQATQ